MGKLMTLDELWEELKKDPECKATIEEADKAYKLLKKMENLIISDLEAKLAESEEEIKNIQQVSDKYYGLYKEKFNRVLELAKENNQLKQQLAEKDVELELARNTSINTNKMDIIHLQAENLELEQQLAEKDVEIEQWKSMAERSSSILDRFNYCGESIVYKTTRDQDKISFAVEQLEKVKEFFLEEHRDEEMDTDYIITKDAGAIADYLLDQIKELKEQK